MTPPAPDPAQPATGPPSPTSPPAPRRREYVPALDVIRIVAILGVVAVHVVGGGVEDGSAPLGITAVDMAASAAVPVFLMMAGALNLHPSALRRGPGAFWRQRAVRILPALVVWSAFYMLVIGPLAGAEMSVGTAIDQVITGKTFTHLYFLWAIAGLYVIAPVIASFLHAVPELEGRRAWGLGLLACAWTALAFAVPYLTRQPSIEGLDSHRPIEPGSLTYWMAFAGYFVIGRAAIVAPVARRWALAALATTPLAIAALTWLYEAGRDDGGSLLVRTLRPDYSSPSVMVYALLLFPALASLTGAWRVGPRAQAWLRALGNATFGVFLVHFAVLVLLRQIPALEGYDLWQMATVWLVTVPVSFVIALVAQRVPGLRLIF